MNDPVAFDEYIIYANSLGIYEPFYIQMEYNLYLAILTNDLDIIKKAINSYYYNIYYKNSGRLN